MRQLLHFLAGHLYSKWEDYHVGQYRDTGNIFIFQTRRCGECGKVEIRKARADL